MKIQFNTTVPDILIGGKKVVRWVAINEGGTVNSFGLVIGRGVFDVRLFGYAFIWQPKRGLRMRRSPFWFLKDHTITGKLK